MNRYILIFLCQAALLFSISTVANAQLKDSSDNLWSIVIPEAQSIIVDMGTVEINKSKDSVISSYIDNIGEVPVRIDSISFRGSEANSFSLVSTIFPLVLDVDMSVECEFRFKPTVTGNHNAEVVVHVPGSEISNSITGNCLSGVININDNLIDFGDVFVYEFKDIVKAVLVNKSSSVISVTETEITGPDTKQFSIISGGGSFVIQPDGGQHEIEIRFAPDRAGKTSSQTAFTYDGIGSPAIVNLFGNGVVNGQPSTVLRAVSTEAGNGETIGLIIKLENSNLLKESNITAIEFKLNYNSTVLYPIDYENASTIDNIGTIDGQILISENADNSELIVDFKTALGNAEFSNVFFTDYHSVGADADIDTVSGTVNISDICYEGGTRLIRTIDTENIIEINSSNPVDESLDVTANFVESISYELFISDIKGKTLRSSSGVSSVGSKSFSFLTSELPSGKYFITLKTTAVQVSKNFDIIR